MRKKQKIILAFTLLLIALAFSNVFALYERTGVFSGLYSGYLLFGLLGCLFLLSKHVLARWSLVIFYSIQSVAIHGENFKYNFTTGLAIPISVFEGTIEESFIEPRGYSINLLSIIMIVLCFKYIKYRKIQDDE